MTRNGAIDMELETKELIKKATSRSNLTRVEQRRIGLLLNDALTLIEFQKGVIKKIKVLKESITSS